MLSSHFQIGTNLGDFQYLYIDFCLATIFVLVSKEIGLWLCGKHFNPLQWGSMVRTLCW